MQERTYNCIIVDDERFARELIADYLKKHSDIKLLGKYKNTALAKEVLDSQTPIDIIFLDIQMPNETGIDFLKKQNIQAKVIFTTAYSEYALESYDLDAVDYLLKPINEERFDKAITKVKTLLDTEYKAQALNQSDDTSQNYLTIKSGAEVHKLYLNELIHLEAEGEYIKYITKDKEYYVLGSLKKLAEELPSSFLQVHRSHIIALDHIKAREHYNLILKDLSRIPIGKTYRSEVLKVLKEEVF